MGAVCPRPGLLHTVARDTQPGCTSIQKPLQQSISYLNQGNEGYPKNVGSNAPSVFVVVVHHVKNWRLRAQHLSVGDSTSVWFCVAQWWYIIENQRDMGTILDISCATVHVKSQGATVGGLGATAGVKGGDKIALNQGAGRELAGGLLQRRHNHFSIATTETFIFTLDFIEQILTQFCLNF